MSHEDADRIVAAARRLRARDGAGFAVTALARPAGMSRATLYRRLAADGELAAEVSRIQREGARKPREELLCAATAILAEKGLAGLTMDAIAARAGFSTATLYRHFADREGIVREVLRGALSAEPVRRTLASEGTLEEVLARFVEATMTRLREQPYLLRLLVLGDEEQVRALRRMRRDEERLSTALVALLERPEHRGRIRSMSPQRLSASLMGQVLAAVLFQRMHDGGEPPDPRTIVSLFLHGAARRAPRSRLPAGERGRR